MDDERENLTWQAFGQASRELAQAIAAHPDDIEAALAVYEAAMFGRNESFAADAREILELCLGDRAPFGLIDFLTSAPAGERVGAGQP